MEWQLTINSQLTELAEVKRNLGKILQEANLTLELSENSQLIAEEVLVNIIEYGYGDGTDNHIEMCIEKKGEHLIMTFEDTAKPFNPLIDITTPNLDADDIDRPIGGLGFFLVEELAERVDYDYHDGKNVLTITQILEIQ
jgi:sigma-B regulation protein RsbU (phosphoserine phosphatase)